MGFSKLFIDRPILAGVISVMIMLVGAVAYFALPISQYPEVAPPSITVTASYPGANAETAAATVAAPLEQEINGVEGMLYLSSQSTADGRTTITVTFALGTDLDAAQVLVQNRVNIALPRLPEEVRRLGVVTNKNTPDILMVVHIYSPDGSRDQLYLSNYTLLNIRDRLARLDGVGDLRLVRRARILDAHLARSEPDFRAGPDRRRGGAGASRSERPGRRRRAGSSAVDATRRLRGRRPAPRPPHGPRAVRGRADQERRRRPAGTRA